MDRQLTAEVLYPDALRASLARERLGMTLLVIVGIMNAALAAVDARVFVVAPLALSGVAAMASFLPARRATKLDPADLLRIG